MFQVLSRGLKLGLLGVNEAINFSTPFLFLISSSLVHSVDLYKIVCRALVKESSFLLRAAHFSPFPFLRFSGFFEDTPMRVFCRR